MEWFRVEPNSSQVSPLGCLCVVGRSEFCAACRQGAGGLEYWGSKKESLRSPPPSSHLPLTLSPLPALQVEPGRKSTADDHRSSARVRHRADLPESRAGLPGEAPPSAPPLVSDRVLPRSLLSKRHSSSPPCAILLFGRSCYS